MDTSQTVSAKHSEVITKGVAAINIRVSPR
jgi:hypothetical protein